LNTRHLEWLLVANLLGDTELAEKVWNPINVTFTAQDPQLDENEDSWVVELLPNMMSFALYMVIIMSSGVMIAAVTDEKKNRVMEVLLSSVSTDQLIAGKIIAVGVLGLFIIAAWLIVFWAIAKFGGQALSIPQGFTLPTNLLVWSIVFALFGYAIYGAQMAGVGALVPDIKDSRSITFIVLAPLILVYVFLVAIVANPNGLIAVILSFFPLTSPIAMVARMAATDIPWWQSLIAALLQLAAIIFIIRLVARLFHAQTLLSGQSVSAKQYYKVLMGR
jgi:ABC-2 type transport system permease protein